MEKKVRENKRANRPEKGTPAYFQQQYNIARYNLLAAVLFTLVNLVLLLTGGDYYFLFSISVPYYGTALAQLFELETVMLVISAVLLAAYLACFLLSKKYRGVMIAALVLFLLDCVALVGLTVWLELYSDMILDILFHGWVVYYLIQAVRYGAKLDTMHMAFDFQEEAVIPNASPEIGAKPETPNRGPEID